MRGVADDLVDAQVAVRAVAQGDRPGRPAELLLGQGPASEEHLPLHWRGMAWVCEAHLHGHAVLLVAKAQASVLRGHRDA